MITSNMKRQLFELALRQVIMSHSDVPKEKAKLMAKEAAIQCQ